MTNQKIIVDHYSSAKIFSMVSLHFSRPYKTLKEFLIMRKAYNLRLKSAFASFFFYHLKCEFIGVTMVKKKVDEKKLPGLGGEG